MKRSSLPERKRCELLLKLDGLGAELERWSELTTSGKLTRHASQVELITEVLSVALVAIHDDVVDARGGENEIVDACGVYQDQLVDLNRVWEFFRVKLEQRFVASLEPFLILADELAWDCYKAVGTAGREPPLTFLNSGGSPFVLARGERFVGVDSVRLRSQLQALPIAVVGLPWHQLQHPPDALAVCHEVGHAIEEDLLLEETIQAHVTSAALTHHRAWTAWAGEVFADVYATLAVGSAYTACLADFAARSRRGVVASEPAEPDWGEYPTPTLRVLASAAVCGADGVVEEWRSTFRTHRLEAFEEEAGAVGRALADGVYPQLGNRSLRDVIGFDDEMRRDAREDAGRLRAGRAPESTEIRPLIVAARWAFERNPRDYIEAAAATVLLEHVRDHVVVARRGTRRLTSPVQHQAAGELLLQRVRATNPASEESSYVQT